MRSIELTTKRVDSFDGSELVYHVTTGGARWVLLADGLGARMTGWRHLVDYLRDDYRFISWDYRCLYPQEDLRQKPGGVRDHARDLACVLRAEGIESCAWIGASLGARVMLQAMGEGLARPSQLILLSPALAQPRRHTGKVRRLAFEGLVMAHSLLESATKRAARWPETVSWLKRLGLVGSTIDEEAFAAVVSTYAEANLGAYLSMLRSMYTQDCAALLSGVDVPTLVVLGDRDRLSPRSTAEPLARRIPDAELFVIRQATHLAALEFPEMINLRIEKFFREHTA